SRGHQRLAVSNRVALCLPRFIVIRSEMVMANQLALTGPGALRLVNGYAAFKIARPSIEYVQTALLENVRSTQRPSSIVETIGTAIIGRVAGVVVIGNVYAVKSMEAACQLGPEVPEGPLIIIKWPDRYCALIGDIVTFTLKYTNTGGRPITNVIVSDSLANRL